MTEFLHKNTPEPLPSKGVDNDEPIDDAEERELRIYGNIEFDPVNYGMVAVNAWGDAPPAEHGPWIYLLDKDGYKKQRLVNSPGEEGMEVISITEEEIPLGIVPRDIRTKKDVDPNGVGQHEPGAKLDHGKPDASLLKDFGLALLEIAKVSTVGAKKYTRGGWQHVDDGHNRYTAAMMRHFFQEKLEDIDEDTQMLHMAMTAWNALARLELYLRED